MPELPDVEIYIENLARRIRGARLNKIDVLNPFLLFPEKGSGPFFAIFGYSASRFSVCK